VTKEKPIPDEGDGSSLKRYAYFTITVWIAVAGL
jgi:hypothetical protein